MSDRTTAYLATRDTRFRLLSLAQRANGYSVACEDIESNGTPPPSLDLAEEDFTLDEHEALIQLFAVVEGAVARRVAALAAEADTPQKVNARIRDALIADQRKVEAEKRSAELDAEIAKKEARLAALETAEGAR